MKRKILKISLVGKTNAGKSTLLNNLVGEKISITNKKIKSANYDIDTYKKIIYVYGISQNEEERAEVINEANKVLDVQDVVTSIFLVEDLRVVKN